MVKAEWLPNNIYIYKFNFFSPNRAHTVGFHNAILKPKTRLRILPNYIIIKHDATSILKIVKNFIAILFTFFISLYHWTVSWILNKLLFWNITLLRGRDPSRWQRFVDECLSFRLLRDFPIPKRSFESGCTHEWRTKRPFRTYRLLSNMRCIRICNESRIRFRISG